VIQWVCGIKYLINILWNFVVYRSKICDVSELKRRLIDEWSQFDQSIVDAAVSERRRRLNVGNTLNTNSGNFETNL